MSRTAVSLFAGVGGFDIALRNNGYKVIASVEIDKQCNKVLEQHFPDSKRYTDIKEVKGKDLINDGFKATKGIITGGFPCQDLSVAGKRAGLTGSRSGLYWEAHRLLDETKSETFILENVPGLLSSNGGKDFGIVLGSLVELGYSVGWRVLDAQHFGVPQRRRRVFIVGSRLGEEGIIKVLFERSSVSRNITQSKQEGQGITSNTTESTRDTSWWNGSQVADTVTTKSNSQFMPDKNRLQVVVENQIVGTLQARDYKGVGNQYVEENKLVVEQERTISNTIPASLYHRGSLNNQDVDSGHLVVFKPHQEDGARIQNEVVNTLTAQMGTGGNNVPMVAYDELNNTINNTHHTLRSGTKQSTGVISNKQVRRLTPKECERLQGFPDDWTSTMADSNRYKQMGNAVAVPVVNWLVKGFNE
jgi:DNA (cytosine-5)-methyltransferase 1